MSTEETEEANVARFNYDELVIIKKALENAASGEEGLIDKVGNFIQDILNKPG